MLLEWRHLSKLITTYTESLPKFINNVSGRVHTTFEATLTSTGRLSSKNPNLQNIPIKTLEGNQIRKAFVAEENSMIISADYSQIELRVLAEMAGIDSLKEAFQQNQDIHTVTASQIFKIPLINVTQDIRRRAKEINFGIIYGISAYGLAKNLDIPKNIAALYIEDYFRQYPGIKKYMEETINFAKQNGYVKTMFGRKCYIQDIENPNYLLRSFAERTTINAPIQGTAADIMKKAMVSLSFEISKYLILQVHDELLFEVPKDKVDMACSYIKKSMENIYYSGPINLKLPVKIEVGDSWYSSKSGN